MSSRELEVAGLLAEGRSIPEVARTLGCTQREVREVVTELRLREQLGAWRATGKDESAAQLNAARTRAQAALPSVLDKLVREVLDPRNRGAGFLASAKALFDRLGLPAVSTVATAPASALDLSALTDEELRTWEALQRKALREDG